MHDQAKMTYVLTKKWPKPHDGAEETQNTGYIWTQHA